MIVPAFSYVWTLPIVSVRLCFGKHAFDHLVIVTAFSYVSNLPIVSVSLCFGKYVFDHR